MWFSGSARSYDHNDQPCLNDYMRLSESPVSWLSPSLSWSICSSESLGWLPWWTGSILSSNLPYLSKSSRSQESTWSTGSSES